MSDSVGAQPQRSVVTIGGANGSFPGETNSVSYRVEMIDLTEPSRVTLNGQVLAGTTAGSGTTGWYYDNRTDTVVISTGTHPVSEALTVVATGGSPTNLPEPS
jgi:hypothetical protein